MLKGVSMASKSSQSTGIDRQIPDKNTLYRSPPEARSLKGWVSEVETKRADKGREVDSKRTMHSRDQEQGESKRSRKSSR